MSCDHSTMGDLLACVLFTVFSAQSATRQVLGRRKKTTFLFCVSLFSSIEASDWNVDWKEKKAKTSKLCSTCMLTLSPPVVPV